MTSTLLIVLDARARKRVVAALEAGGSSVARLREAAIALLREELSWLMAAYPDGEVRANAGEQTPPGDGAGVVVVALAAASRGALDPPGDAGDGRRLRAALERRGALADGEVDGVAVSLSPPMDREAALERWPDLVVLDPKTVANRQFCEFCGAPFAADRTTCPSCAAPAAG